MRLTWLSINYILIVNLILLCTRAGNNTTLKGIYKYCYAPKNKRLSIALSNAWVNEVLYRLKF